MNVFFQQLQKLCLPVNSINKMFRANDVINGLNKKPTDVRGDDFSAARRAQIELVVENNAIKKFARSQVNNNLRLQFQIYEITIGY